VSDSSRGEWQAGREPAVDRDRASASASDRVGAAAEELYAGDPEAFADRRKALAAAARAASDKASATAIAALRKPTRAAWVVNRLVRADPDTPARLVSLAAALRAAEQARDGPRLRELSAARGLLIDSLTVLALDGAGIADTPPSLRAEVSATLTAALADPEVAAAFAAGTLTRAAHWSGFGTATDWPRSPTISAEAKTVTGAGTGAEIDGDAETGSGWQPRQQAAESSSASRSRRNAPRSQVPAAARLAAEKERRLAREAAERVARRLENYQDAERTVASAAIATAETVAVEDRLEAEVRDLEQRLTQARADLASARLDARRAEAAERRARNTLDGLSR
jgi:hypothetical protein